MPRVLVIKRTVVVELSLFARTKYKIRKCNNRNSRDINITIKYNRRMCSTVVTQSNAGPLFA